MAFYSCETRQQQQSSRRRSRRGALMVLAFAAVMTGDASAFSPQLQTPLSTRVCKNSIPHDSFRSTELSMVASIETLNPPAKGIKDATKIDDFDPNEKIDKNGEDGEWELWIYDDTVNTREGVASALVRVTGRSEIEAFRTMNEAHTTGIALVDSNLPLEIAEAYNEGLRKHGIVSEIVPCRD